MHIPTQGNMKEELKQLQETEQAVINQVTELAGKKETFRVSELTPQFFLIN